MRTTTGLARPKRIKYATTLIKMKHISVDLWLEEDHRARLHLLICIIVPGLLARTSRRVWLEDKHVVLLRYEYASALTSGQLRLLLLLLELLLRG